ncbi:hypothetical protein Q604_UNBC17130G0001, partial [human gut metagenome]
FRYALKLSLLKEQQATLLIQKRLLEQMNPLKNDQTFVISCPFNRERILLSSRDETALISAFKRFIGTWIFSAEAFEIENWTLSS